MDTLVRRRMAAQSVIADSGSYRRSPTNSRMFRPFLLLVCAVPAIAIGAREGQAPEWVREVAADKDLQVDPEMVGVRLEPTARRAFLFARCIRYSIPTRIARWAFAALGARSISSSTK